MKNVDPKSGMTVPTELHDVGMYSIGMYPAFDVSEMSHTG